MNSVIFSFLSFINIFILILATIALITVVFILPKQLRKISAQMEELINLTKRKSGD